MKPCLACQIPVSCLSIQTGAGGQINPGQAGLSDPPLVNRRPKKMSGNGIQVFHNRTSKDKGLELQLPGEGKQALAQGSFAFLISKMVKMKASPSAWTRWARSKGRGPERCPTDAESPPRSGLPALAICNQPRGGSAKRSEREEEEEEGGGPNKRVPQRTMAGSNPAWAPSQRRKLPVVGLESDAGGWGVRVGAAY